MTSRSDGQAVIRRGRGTLALWCPRPSWRARALVRRHRGGRAGSDASCLGGRCRRARGRRGRRRSGGWSLPAASLAHHRLPGGARLCVHRTFPSHAGLGSGTQLALAVARALAEVHRVPTDARGLARSVGRAPRSAIGTWTFAGGGLVLEGGRRPESEDAAPLLARLPFPASWRCVVAVPHSARGISGIAEEVAFYPACRTARTRR